MRIGINTGNGLSLTNAGELVSTNPTNTDSALFSFEGTVTTQEGSARWYPPQDCTLYQIYSYLTEYSTINSVFVLRKNGQIIPNLNSVVEAGSNKSEILYPEIPLTTTDYISCDVQEGGDGVDAFVNILVKYEVDGVSTEIAKDIASKTKLGQVKVGEGLRVTSEGLLTIDPATLPLPVIQKPTLMVRDNYDISYYYEGEVKASSVILRHNFTNTCSFTGVISASAATIGLSFYYPPDSYISIYKHPKDDHLNPELIGTINIVTMPTRNGEDPYTEPGYNEDNPDDPASVFSATNLLGCAINAVFFEAGDYLTVKTPSELTDASNRAENGFTGLAFTIGGVGNTTDILATGPQGSTGAKGDRGFDGPQGKSAYDVAVLNGFTGTEAEWLLSLRGPVNLEGLPAMRSIPIPTYFNHTEIIPSDQYYNVLYQSTVIKEVTLHVGDVVRLPFYMFYHFTNISVYTTSETVLVPIELQILLNVCDRSAYNDDSTLLVQNAMGIPYLVTSSVYVNNHREYRYSDATGTITLDDSSLANTAQSSSTFGKSTELYPKFTRNFGNPTGDKFISGYPEGIADLYNNPSNVDLSALPIDSLAYVWPRDFLTLKLLNADADSTVTVVFRLLPCVS